MKYRKGYDEINEEKASSKHSSKLSKQPRKSSLNKNNTLNTNKSVNNELLQQQLLGNVHVSNQFNSEYSFIEKQLIEKLKIECFISGKEALWAQFEQLTKGQQQAFLADLYKLSKESYELPRQHDWGKWEKHFSHLSQMPLEKEEVYKEVRNNEQLNVQSFYEIKVEQFISPYREILIWLNYKGNHQHKVNILRRFEQLPIDRKKWLIHKILKGKKVSAQSFAAELEITVFEQTSVDWDKIIMCLDEQEQMTEQNIINELEQLDTEDLEKLTDTADVIEDSQTSFLFGLLSDDENEKKVDENAEYHSLIQHWCKSAEQLNMLLFNKGLNEKQQTISAIDLLAFVDRIFMISTSANEKAKKTQREQLLKRNGFVSAVAFANDAIEKVARTLYEQGVGKRDKNFYNIISRLGFSNDALPSQEQLLKKLYILYLG